MLCCRKVHERLLEHGLQKIADARERERRLAFGRASDEDAEPAVARFLETRPPEGGLAYAGIAFERERDRSSRDARHEIA